MHKLYSIGKHHCKLSLSLSMHLLSIYRKSTSSNSSSDSLSPRQDQKTLASVGKRKATRKKDKKSSLLSSTTTLSSSTILIPPTASIPTSSQHEPLLPTSASTKTPPFTSFNSRLDQKSSLPTNSSRVGKGKNPRIGKGKNPRVGKGKHHIRNKKSSPSFTTTTPSSSSTATTTVLLPPLLQCFPILLSQLQNIHHPPHL